MAKTDRRSKKPASPRLPYDVKVALNAAEDKKAVDVIVLDLRKSSAFTDFFVICTGGNIRQVQAIADRIEEALEQKGLKPALTEGYERGQWILIDYFDFIVHIFSPATRDYYGLERLWGDAKKIEIKLAGSQPSSARTS
jgi:ribosome-associated protein